MNIKSVLFGSAVVRRAVTGGVVALGLFVGAAACSVSVSGADCHTDDTVSCGSGATGWSCSAGAPEDHNSSLICSTDGAGDYCCWASSCGYDSSVNCNGGATPYSCASGDNAPDVTDPSLVCSEPTPVGGTDEYCCYTNATVVTSSTCGQDGSVTCPTPGSYGFSCTGSDTPDQDYSGITCSDGVQTSSATTFCCSYQ